MKIFDFLNVIEKKYGAVGPFLYSLQRGARRGGWTLTFHCPA